MHSALAEKIRSAEVIQDATAGLFHLRLAQGARQNEPERTSQSIRFYYNHSNHRCEYIIQRELTAVVVLRLLRSAESGRERRK